MFALAIVHRAVQVNTAVEKHNVRLRYVLPLALVLTSIQLEHGCGHHMFIAIECTSTTNRRVSRSPILAGCVNISHKQQHDRYNVHTCTYEYNSSVHNKISICAQHCCTGTKLHIDDLPDFSSYNRTNTILTQGHRTAV